jgi:hypothetical protein
MALKKTVTTIAGLNAESAYHRVEEITIFNKYNIKFTVRGYVDIKKPCFCEKSFLTGYDLSQDNPIKQAYEHLKTLPEFAGAVDY